jgi:hypothetical protein
MEEQVPLGGVYDRSLIEIGERFAGSLELLP